MDAPADGFRLLSLGSEVNKGCDGPRRHPAHPTPLCSHWFPRLEWVGSPSVSGGDDLRTLLRGNFQDVAAKTFPMGGKEGVSFFKKGFGA